MPDEQQPNDAPSPIETNPTVTPIPQAPATLQNSTVPNAQPIGQPIAEPIFPATSEPLPQPTPLPTPIVSPEPMFGGTPVVPPPKKKRKALIIGIIAAVVVVLLSGASASAYFFWYQNPNKVVGDAVVNAITAKTVSATGVVDIKGKSSDYTMKIEIAGRNSLEGSASVAVKLTFSSKEISYTIDGAGVYDSNGDMYVKVNDVQKLVDSIEKQSDGQYSFDAFNDVIKKIDGNWIKITKEDLGDVSKDYEKTQKCFSDISKSLDSDASLRKTVQNETEKLYKENQFLVIGDSLGSRTISGQGSLGYILTIDYAKADTFFTSFETTELGKKVKACDESIKFADIVNGDGGTSDKAGTEAQLWVSRFGHSITEFNWKTSDDEAEGTIVINPVFNKNETVTIPTNSVDLSEIMSDIQAVYDDLYSSYSYPDEAVSDTGVNYN